MSLNLNVFKLKVFNEEKIRQLRQINLHLDQLKS